MPGDRMTHFAAPSSATSSATQVTPLWSEAQVAVVLDEHCCLLDDGRLARPAASCLLAPETGDIVLAVAGRSGESYIVHLLKRSREDEAELHVPNAHRLTLRQSQIGLVASEDISLHALRDVEVTAATGTLSLAARNLFSTVHDTVVQSMRHYVGKAEQYLLDARQLLKLHGKQAIVTAEHDVKVDGERISVG